MDVEFGSGLIVCDQLCLRATATCGPKACSRPATREDGEENKYQRFTGKRKKDTKSNVIRPLPQEAGAWRFKGVPTASAGATFLAKCNCNFVSKSLLYERRWRRKQISTVHWFQMNFRRSGGGGERENANAARCGASESRTPGAWS